MTADPSLHHDHVATLLAPIRTLLDDPEVSEIMINGPASIFFERDGRLHNSDCRFPSHEDLMAAVRAMAQFVGKQVGEVAYALRSFHLQEIAFQPER